MFCSKCGKQLADGSKFCIQCGEPVSRMEAPTPSPEQEQAVTQEQKPVQVQTVIQEQRPAQVQEPVQVQAPLWTQPQEPPRASYDRGIAAGTGTQDWMEKVWRCGGDGSVLAAGLFHIISLFIYAGTLFYLIYIVINWNVGGATTTIFTYAALLVFGIFMQPGIPLMMIFASSKRRKRSTGGYSWIRAISVIKIVITSLLSVVASGVFIYLTVMLSQITKYVNQLKSHSLLNDLDELSSLLGYDGLNTRIAMFLSEEKTWGYTLIGNVLETTDYSIGTCWAILIGALVLTVCIIVMYILFQAKMIGNMNLATDVLQGHPLGNKRNISVYSIVMMWFMFIIQLFFCISGKLVWITYTLSCFLELMALSGARKKLKA